MKIRTAYGRVIHDARTSRGLSIRAASARAHISLGYWHEIEHGKKEASSESLGSILSSLDVSPSEFFTLVADQYQVEAA